MIPVELEDKITAAAGVPSLKDLHKYGVGVRFCGHFTPDALNFKRTVSEKPVWRKMRQAALIPTTASKMQEPHYDERLHRVHLGPVYAPLTQEASAFHVWKNVYSFVDQEGRYCLYNSTYDDGMGFKEWMDAYGLWKQVEHYSNSTNECFAVDSRNKRLPGWRCRDRVFILRLAS